MTEAATTTTIWTIDPAHSVLEFAVRHMMLTTVKGRFLDFGGTIAFDAHDIERSRVEVTIQTSSIATGIGDRDAHLRNADFFDVEHHPTAIFRSTRVESRGGDRFSVHGDLTIMDVTREVVLDVVFQGTGTIPGGHEVVAFSATTSFNRSAFGLTWNVALENSGVLVSDEVRLSLDIQAAKAVGEPALQRG
jgi:polyisoprenoid-binding protein YceI